MKFNNIIRFIFILYSCIFVFQAISGYFVLHNLLFSQATNELHHVVDRVYEDLQYDVSTKTWDMSRYNADPELPDTDSLYIFTSDGFVLDRLKPINGFLDTANFSQLLSYTSPTTVVSPSQQEWRLLSMPIGVSANPSGVVTVGYFAPPISAVSDVDKKLSVSLNHIASLIQYNNAQIDVSKVDPRDIPYDITYEIVNNYNKVLSVSYNTNSITRLPTYIDRSYVRSSLDIHDPAYITALDTHIPYIVLTKQLTSSHNVTGIVVVGTSIQYINEILQQYMFTQIVISIIGVITVIVLTICFRSSIKNHLQQKSLPVIAIKQLAFSKEKSTIFINEIPVPIPYATNQYNLCELIFQQPSKKWEVDEILDYFGIVDQNFNTRKVYDAMLAVNKKCQPYLEKKLIITEEKTYQLNPELRGLIVNLK